MLMQIYDGYDENAPVLDYGQRCGLTRRSRNNFRTTGNVAFIRFVSVFSTMYEGSLFNLRWSSVDPVRSAPLNVTGTLKLPLKKKNEKKRRFLSSKFFEVNICRILGFLVRVLGFGQHFGQLGSKLVNIWGFQIKIWVLQGQNWSNLGFLDQNLGFLRSKLVKILGE